MENERTINWLKQSISTREKKLEELRTELAVLLKAIPSLEASL